MPTGMKPGKQTVDLDELLEDLLAHCYRQLGEGALSQQKVSIGDYLKLVTMVAERRRQSEPVHNEVTVRWEESFEQDNACS
ncbi:MAG: hypothetical protein MUF01_06385 [Bryobacterales bacterium]|nr:hypothetical protein [Bryobacterales bacterium]